MKQVFVILTLTLILLVISTQSVLAVSNAAVLYLRVAAGARPAGMGEAFVSIADDATATYWNPAGLGNAPLSGMLKSDRLPSSFGEITDIVSLKGNKGIETWVIADGRLLRFEGTKWSTGASHVTSSDQTLKDFLKTIINVENEEKLDQMARVVVQTNCNVSFEELQVFIETINKNLSEDYDARDDLLQGLTTMEEGYIDCRLNVDQFRNLQKRLNEGMKDSVMTSEEIDRITYSIDRAVDRFLPRRLIVPYSAGIDGKLTCLGSTEKYLWVGTDNGLYRRSGNKVWARFTAPDALPTNGILTLANADDYLLIGTDKGPVQYYHGSFKKFIDVPEEPVQHIAFPGATNGYALIGGVIYSFDGTRFTEGYNYTVRIDDNLDKLVDRTGIYFTREERQFLHDKIRQLNQVRESKVEPVLGETGNQDTAASAGPASQDLATPDGEEGIQASDEVESADSTGDKLEATAPVQPIENWLVEGENIKLPFSPRFRYDVTCLAVDLKNVLWVGTTGGLLSFDGSTWTRYGYEKFIVPAGDSLEEAPSWSAEKIARYFLPGGDSTRIGLLSENIDDFNRLDGDPVAVGDSVYVYNSNIGSKITSIGELHGRLYVGTEYGLMKRQNEDWEEIEYENLDQRQVLDVYNFEGQAYYASKTGLTTETSGKPELTWMHVKWLPNLNLDMYYEYASFVHHFRGIGTIGLSLIYLNYGTIEFTGETGEPLGEGHPFELAINVSYGTSLSNSIKWGITGKFIHSRLSEQGTAWEQGEGIASAFAVDMGILYKMSRRLTFGAAITNLGPDISYIDAAQKDPLPRNLGIGFSYRLINSEYNRLIMQIETNKLLVDMNRSFSREMETAIRHIGAEYVYSDLISLRAGYKYDKEGQVKHLTFGAGLNINLFMFDFAYVPSNEDSPLANTIRVSLSLRL